MEEDPGMMAKEKVCEAQQQDETSELIEGRHARIMGTAIVAVGMLVLIFTAAAAVFFLLAELLQGEWLLVAGVTLVLVGLVWAANRLVRVAANQNKDPLG